MKTVENNIAAIPLAIEPYDKEWGVGVSGLIEEPSPFPRVNRILNRLKATDNSADAQRALIYTRAMKEYAMHPQIIRNAMAFRDIMQQVEINIWPDELIVGELAAPPKHAPVYPEFSIDWLCDELVNAPFDERTNDRYVISGDTTAKLLSIQEDWRGKTVSEAIVASYSDEERKGSHLGKCVVFDGLFVYAGIGHVCADYETLLREGFGGIRARIIGEMERLDPSKPGDSNKQVFYKAALIALEGATSYIRRYGELAAVMADKESDAARKSDLLRISSNCLHVSQGGPRDFWEAVQLWHIATNMIIVETNGHSVTYGRFDRLFIDFYMNDIASGTLSREQMQEIIELSFLKMHELCKIRDKTAIRFSSGTIMGGTALDVGGVDEQGNDITNDLSYMVLDAHAHTRIPNPWMGVRLHKGSPPEFKTKTFNVIRIGTGEPKIFNDEPMIKSLMRYGKPIGDARNYVGIGCVEPAVPGKTYGWHDSSSFNIAKVVQLALNHGRCIDCGTECSYYTQCGGVGKGLGPDTGGLDTFEDFSEVVNSFDSQMKFWCDMMTAMIQKIDMAHQRLKPLPYLSLIVQDCIGKGVDVSAGGALYNHSGPQCVGVGTAADSLSVVKQIIFDEKKVTGAELLDALKKNWVGYEPLRALVNSDKMHHYGNDDDYADDLARLVIETYCKHVEHRPTAHGGEFMPGVYSVSNNVLHGAVDAATPDGREAYEPVSDCLGPVHTSMASHDRNGPSAVANSVTKYDHSRIANGVILNWKFSPGAVSGEVGRDCLMTLMEDYFERQGMQSQFSIIGRDTMLAAQEDPKEYQNLLVRIAGYSAYFVELSRELQNDLISRTEMSFD